MTANEISEEMIFSAAREQYPEEARLLSLELAVVSGLDGEKTVKEIAEVLDLKVFETKKIIEKLLASGFVEKIDYANRFLYVPVDVLQKIEEKLILIMGPVAPVIVDDVLRQLNKRKNNFDKSSMALFIDILTNNISNLKKQYQFQVSIWDDVNSFLI